MREDIRMCQGIFGGVVCGLWNDVDLWNLVECEVEMMAERSSFIVHFESFKYFSRLSDEQLGMLFRALCNYAENGTEPVFGDDVTDIIFEMLRDRLNRDAEKYDEICKKNARNAKKGGRPRKTERFSDKSEKTERFFEKPKKADSECECDPECDPDRDPVCECECDPDAARAAAAAPDFPHTPHTAEELTVEWVLRFAREQGYVWTQEEAERFIDFNRKRGRSDGWDFAAEQWEKNRPRMSKQRSVSHRAATPEQDEQMNEYLSLVNRFKEDSNA